jgi:hypothetical protein
MSYENTNSSELGQLLDLLAAANTLSPDETHGTRFISASQTQSNINQSSPFINGNSASPSSLFVTREAKVEMINLAQTEEPCISASSNENLEEQFICE